MQNPCGILAISWKHSGAIAWGNPWGNPYRAKLVWDIGSFPRALGEIVQSPWGALVIWAAVFGDCVGKSRKARGGSLGQFLGAMVGRLVRAIVRSPCRILAIPGGIPGRLPGRFFGELELFFARMPGALAAGLLCCPVSMWDVGHSWMLSWRTALGNLWGNLARLKKDIRTLLGTFFGECLGASLAFFGECLGESLRRSRKFP